MKQEDWVQIMLDSIKDQSVRATKTAERMSTFFIRKREPGKAETLRKVSSSLRAALNEMRELDK